MTVWQLHMLNARGALTPILSEIRAHARDVVGLVSDHLDLPRFDLVVRAGDGVIPDRGIADGGIAGHAPAPGIIELTLDPARVTPEHFRRTLVHELHHLARWEGPGYGRSLGGALVSEGLAGHFVLQVLGGPPDPWDRVRPPAGSLRQAATLWARHDYGFGDWFLGRGRMRKWTGYGLGHRLVAAHLAQAGGDAASLVHAPAEPFRAALRRLMAEEGVEAPEEEDEDDAGADGVATDEAGGRTGTGADGSHPAVGDRDPRDAFPRGSSGPSDSARPDDAQPAAVQPCDAQPGDAQGDAIQPDAIQPDAVRAHAVQRNLAQPDAAQPDAVQPNPPQPAAVQPAAVHSGAGQSSAVKSDAVQHDATMPDRTPSAGAASDAVPAEGGASGAAAAAGPMPGRAT